MINYQQLGRLNTPSMRWLRQVRRSLRNLALPTPAVVNKPLLWTFLALRAAYYTGLRVFICEPLLKAHCKEYGKRVHTDIYIHWISGRGDIFLGDDVLVDGKCALSFAARYSANPTLRVGSNTYIGTSCSFAIGKEIRIGDRCLIAAEVIIMDSSGHPTDPAARRQGLPPVPESVRPVTIEDDVWIGRRAIILPGVTIGCGSIVGAGAVVTKDVPPRTVVAGNPARVVSAL